MASHIQGRGFPGFSLSFLLLLCGVLTACTPAAVAQSTATATRRADLQIGGTFLYGGSDYTDDVRGWGLYGTYDFRRHFGVEVAFHQANSLAPDQLYQRTYEVGGRYVFHPAQRIHPYVRVMIGRGVMNFPANSANLAYNMGSIGGGFDYNVTRHINFRGDLELQKWFNFPPNGLQPNVVTAGLAWHF